MLTILFNLPSQPTSLTGGYDDFRLETAATLGYGDDPSLWTTQQDAELDRHVQEAYRMILYPTRLRHGGIPHVWSWLHQFATLTTEAGGGDPIVNGSFDEGGDWTKGSGWSIGVIINGEFDTDSDWTKGADWTISGGVATASEAPGRLSQAVAPLTSGTSYVVTYTVSNIGSPVNVYLGTQGGTKRTSNGTYTETIVANGTEFFFQHDNPIGSFTGDIDNVSCVTNGVATGAAASGDLEQSVDPLVDGRTYTVTFTLANVTAGGVRVVLGTRVGTTRSTNGTFTETILANGAAFKFEDDGGNFTGTIDNVSAVRKGEEFYTLPSDFGAMHSRNLTYPAETGFMPIQRTSSQEIRERNQQSSQTNQPWLYALEWAPQTPGLPQRQRIVFYPTPDSSYTLSYEYSVLVGKLSKTNPYPLGGPRMSQLMIEACKAVGEAKKNGARGDQWNIFKEVLEDAIALDASSLTERTVGRMRDPANEPREFAEFSVVSTVGSVYSGIV